MFTNDKIKKALTNKRIMRALTGLSPKEFTELAPAFEEAYEQAKWEKYEKEPRRERKPGAGPKGIVKTTEEKLFLILFYFKCYPTFDVLAFLYDCNRSNACRRQQHLSGILEKALGRKMALPKRQLSRLEELLEVFPQAQDLFIDGTERPTQRPKQAECQRKNDSGKKKRHTRKNLVVCDAEKRVGILSPTVEGNTHDFTMLKDAEWMDWIPPGMSTYLDLGFQGVQKLKPDLSIVMPKKKPKGKELTAEEKKQNKAISRIRIVVENSLAGIKRLRIVSDVFRNRKEGFDDQVMLISCGLWNYHLAQ